jgi:hypothetical protein
MPPFFSLYKGKPKTPGELVARTQAALQALDSASKEKDIEKAGCDAALLYTHVFQGLYFHRTCHHSGAFHPVQVPRPVDSCCPLPERLSRCPVIVTQLSGSHKIPRFSHSSSSLPGSFSSQDA